MLLFSVTLLNCNKKTDYIFVYNDITCIEQEKIYFNKHNLDKVHPVYILAGIAEHECYNLSEYERHLVMEAVVNRIEDNFNNNGTTLKKQLLAKHQFTGLFKHYPNMFYFDPNNQRHLKNVEMAKDILYNKQRMSEKRIYYWASPEDMTLKTYGKFMRKNKIYNRGTRQTFA